MTIPKQT
jgi:hypothetical protein